MNRNLFFAGLGIFLGLAAIGMMVLVKPYTLRGSVIDPAQPAPEIQLLKADQTEFRLSDYQGKVVLIFFGYTTCPDVCPTTLSEIRQAVNELDTLADRIQVVFISVDPERDTVAHIQNYVAAFDQTFIGLSGTEETLQPVWQAYGVFRAIQPSKSAAGYLVDHSARIYVIDKAGNLRMTYVFGTPVKDMTADLSFLAKEK